MSVDLYPHQQTALGQLKVGSILRGGTGSGKSLTALAYYISKICNTSNYVMESPRDLYIITTALKRDNLEWEQECIKYLLSTDPKLCRYPVKVVIDSWNNIQKYTSVIGAFFIFDEQRVVGSGSWVKSFIRITKVNKWILLTATPGDTWMDYIPVFVANGFYKNRTEFIRRHVVYSRFSKFPKVDHYVEVGRLIKLRDSILINMNYKRPTIPHYEDVVVGFDKEAYDVVMKKRWNIFKDEPIAEVSELCYTLRRVTNSDYQRVEKVKELVKEHGKVIIFYNFDYELELLRKMCEDISIAYSEWNGHKHQTIQLREGEWVYLVQYAAGGEGWNCIETNVIIFYSLNYSYKMMTQAAGRIDRLNTPFTDLYFYKIRSNSSIDLAIYRCLNRKKDFNQYNFIEK